MSDTATISSPSWLRMENYGKRLTHNIFEPFLFGEAITAKRQKERLSYLDIETITGVDRSNIQRICFGSPPSIEAFIRLSHFLNS